MTVKNQVLRLFQVLAMCLLFAPVSAFAQNNLLPANVSNFNIGTIGNGHSSNNLSNVNVTTNYTYKKDENSLLSNTSGPQCYAVGDDARWYNHQSNWTGIEQGFFSMGDHTSGTGNYMIVNGATSSNKKVWEYTVQVSPGVMYDFQAWTTCLFMRIVGLPSLSTCPRLRLKINDHNVGDTTFTVPWVDGGQWTLWSQSWTAGNNITSAKITIIDECTDADGNDFGLDDLVFKMKDGYQVTTNSISEDICAVADPPFEIDLNGHYTITWPTGGNNAPSMQVKIRKNSSGSWATSITTNHGSAYVENNKIYYTPNEGYYGTDSFQYQISRFGLESHSTITVNVMGVPSNCTPQGLPSNGTLCMDAVASFNPSATWTSNGSDIFQSYWEFKKNGITDWLSSGNFSSYVQSNGGIGDYSIRFYAENGCGPALSEEIQLNVIDAATVHSIGDIIPASVCAPAVFSCESPTIENNGSEPISQGWQMQINGQWVGVPNPIEYQHNGCNVRYYVENDCGTSYSQSVPLTVNAVPNVGPITPPVGICAGEVLSLNTPQITWRHDDLTTCWGSWEIQIDGVWDSLVNNNIPYDYNGCYIRYKAVNGCGITYSTNNVQIIVYSREPYYEGVITACDAIYHHGQYCDTTGLYVSNDSITPNGCQIQVSWHFSLGEVNIMPPEVYERCYSYYWPRTGQTYYESTVVYDTVYSNDPQVCDSVFTLDLTINNAPTIQGNIQTHDICVGELLEVTEPEYAYNHNGGGQHQWEYASSLEGPFQSFDPETFHFEYGSYYIRFAVTNSCDSVFSNIISLSVNDQPVINGQLEPLQVCENNLLDLPEVTVDWNNASQTGFAEWQMAESQTGPYASFNPNSQMQTGQNGYWLRYIARNECDTVFLGPTRITVISEQEDWMDHLACDTVWYEGVAYTEDQVIDEVLNEPCLHTIHHRIIVNHSDRPETNPTLIEEITSCHDEFEWHGHTYYRTDGPRIERWVTQNVSGCDSIRELRLDFGEYATKTDYQVECNAFTWSRNDSTYYYDESNPQVLDSVFIPGDEVVCDSIIYLNLLLGGSYELIGEPMTECRGFEWNGVPYFENAIVYDSLHTQITHCDSIVSHQLTIIQPFDTVVEMVNCQPVWWQGHHFIMDEVYQDTLESVVTGCDSIVTVHFRLENYVNEFDTVACDPFEWYGYECNYSPNGMTIQHVFELNTGCDSTVIKHVYIYPPEDSTQFISACDSYLCPFNGVLYDEPGVYLIEKDTAYNQYGCDSIVYRIRLEIKDSEQIGLITGLSDVFVASSLVNGIYRYEVNPEEVQSDITWSLSNPDWQIIESQQNYCLVFVTTPGSVRLTATFTMPDCGMIERDFIINAGFFGVDDYATVVANVYPNPTNGSVTVEAEGIESIRLTDMMGQVLDWIEFDRSNTAVLNLNGLAPSVYLMEIKTVNGMVKKRVVVSR